MRNKAWNSIERGKCACSVELIPLHYCFHTIGFRAGIRSGIRVASGDGFAVRAMIIATGDWANGMPLYERTDSSNGTTSVSSKPYDYINDDAQFGKCRDGEANTRVDGGIQSAPPMPCHHASRSFKWRGLYRESGLPTIGTGEEVMTASELQQAIRQSRRLDRALGKRILENEIPTGADIARRKSELRAHP